MSETAFRRAGVALAVLAALLLCGVSWADDVPGGAPVTIAPAPVPVPVQAAAKDEMALRLQIEPMYMMAYGHEPHVLDIERV